MKKISLNTRSGYKIWVVSDLHLLHDKPFILGPRGYKNVREAYDHTYEMLHQYVGPNDVLINVGDVVVGAGLQTSAVTSRLIHFPCKVHYHIWGNHNAGVIDIYNDIRREKGLLADDIEIYPASVPGTNFTFLGHYVEMEIDARPVVFCHYPIASWNHIGKDAFMIHGHSHRNLKEDLTLKRLDVSWDWKKRPVEWHEIVTELENRKFVPTNHYGKDGWPET